MVFSASSSRAKSCQPSGGYSSYVVKPALSEPLCNSYPPPHSSLWWVKKMPRQPYFLLHLHLHLCHSQQKPTIPHRLLSTNDQVIRTPILGILPTLSGCGLCPISYFVPLWYHVIAAYPQQGACTIFVIHYFKYVELHLYVPLSNVGASRLHGKRGSYHRIHRSVHQRFV